MQRMDNEELINGYFEGSLSEEQKREFDHLFETNADFKTEFEFQEELKRTLVKSERKQLKEILSNTAVPPEKEQPKVIRLRPWLVAASVFVLVGISSWLILFDRTDIDSQNLYNSNFAPYENVVHPIERGEQLEDLKTRAFMAYENENYKEAIELFKTLNEKNNDKYIVFYEAISLMQLNKQDEAIPLLEDYIASSGELKERAIWYLALSYLKLDEIEDCKEQLRVLVHNEGFKKKEAQRLLDELD
ncbi:tetratricopeptide repeat protein [Zobellia alginiliquefaciens]|uniref:tetratricopeptide repeat protein n=1 Tax=Zobellia alginiliquefaciens TaxID=3032586 RepID=UPI0023E3926B|nr:tetratricopeptide repeat protein [Zobellia alginiliquefaciens]